MGKKIVFCNCGGEIIGPERLQSIENKLVKYNTELIKLSDLCGLSAIGKEKLKDVFRYSDEYLIVGCHSRSLKLLLELANVDIIKNSIHYINFSELSDDDIFRDVSSFLQGSNQIATFEEVSAGKEWPSWYPAIDYSRCSGCGQCADFCLFGVYEKSDGGVSVVNPVECKNNCPACARICPRTAIVFPKYKAGGAIGGSDDIDEISEQKRQAIDINNILKGDIYSALEQRKHKRKSIILEDAMKKALEERTDALNKS
jgi:NAD-dependent dihydropyrimidine dehydrogenase PreA subunit